MIYKKALCCLLFGFCVVSDSSATERCRSMIENGGQCSEKPVPGRNYCEKHMKAELQVVKPH